MEGAWAAGLRAGRLRAGRRHRGWTSSGPAGCSSRPPQGRLTGPLSRRGDRRRPVQPHLRRARRRPARWSCAGRRWARAADRARHVPGVPGDRGPVRRSASRSPGRCCCVPTRTSSARRSTSWSTSTASCCAARHCPLWTPRPRGRCGTAAGRHPAAAARDRLRAASGSPTSAVPTGSWPGRCERWHAAVGGVETRQLPLLESVTSGCATTHARRSRAPGDRARRLPAEQRDVRPRRCGGIAAVVDWEMATLGDPLTDVGLLVVYTDSQRGCGVMPSVPRRASRPAEQLAQRYAAGAAGSATGPARLVRRLRLLQARRHLRGHPRPLPAGQDRRRGLRARSAPAVPVLLEQADAALRGQS